MLPAANLYIIVCFSAVAGWGLETQFSCWVPHPHRDSCCFGAALVTCADWLEATFSLLTMWPVYNAGHHLGDGVVESYILLVSNQSQPMIASWKQWAGQFWLLISHPYMWLCYDTHIFKKYTTNPHHNPYSSCMASSILLNVSKQPTKIGNSILKERENDYCLSV